jgi:DNA-cytosine methyltransferase
LIIVTDKMKTHLDLFSGIGGFAIGLAMVGKFEHTFVEYEPHLQRVLKKNFPNSNIHGDITNFTPDFQPWVITGGFPCQDISRANTNKNKGGINGNRSGLWKHYLRVIQECSPKYVIIENVYDLLSNGLGVVVQDLAESGYDSTWTIIDSKFCGVPQRRRRVYILGFRDGITRGADPLNNTKRSSCDLRSKIDAIEKISNWYFEESLGTEHPIAYFTRQRSDEYAECGLSGTIAKRDYKSFTDIVLHGDGKLRRVGVVERLRLQGIPDNWLDDCNLTEVQKYQANGMTIPAVSWVAKQLISYDERLDIQK